MEQYAGMDMGVSFGSASETNRWKPFASTAGCVLRSSFVVSFTCKLDAATHIFFVGASLILPTTVGAPFLYPTMVGAPFLFG